MRDYRIRVYDSQFDSLLELTILKAEASIKTKVSPENLFILGAALGYRSLHKYRGGKKISAIDSGVKSLDKLGDALIISPEFTDPLLGLALYEYGKIKIRRKILGKFGSNYSGVIHQLETVRRQARFVNYNSLYSMQMIYFESGNMSKALEINTILLGRFPENPSVLYNRALILENLGQAANAVIYWKHLIARIQSRTPHSNGYLAECHFKLARYYYLTNMLQDAQRESALAQIYLEQYISLEEMDGPYESFEQIKKNILQLN